MGRVGTHMAVVFAGWGPSGRRFKSCLPDVERELAHRLYAWAGIPLDDSSCSAAGFRPCGRCAVVSAGAMVEVIR